MSSTETSVTTTLPEVLAANSSEAASLKGKPAKTPIIAGTICGAVMLIAWIVALIIYIRKRRRRKKRLAREGKHEGEVGPEFFTTPRQQPPKQEKIIIPPDPAIVMGYRKPGEKAFPDGDGQEKGHPGAGKRKASARKGLGGGGGTSLNGHGHGVQGSSTTGSGTMVEEKDFATPARIEAKIMDGHSDLHPSHLETMEKPGQGPPAPAVLPADENMRIPAG